MPFMIMGELALRIEMLAVRHHRSPSEQLKIMVQAFEDMDIQRVYYLPGPKGCQQVPVVEVSEPILQRRINV